MALPIRVNLKITQGDTFSRIFRWESTSVLYNSISGITKAAPAVITHGGENAIPVGWRFQVESVLGMTQINSDDSEYYIVKNNSGTEIAVDGLNSSVFSTYTSGGVIKFYAPSNLSGFTAKMQIRSKVAASDTLLELSTENGGIILDNTTKTIEVLITSIQTAALTFKSAVYDLELTNNGIVTSLVTGLVILNKEITR